jgi:hypothetical protein
MESAMVLVVAGIRRKQEGATGCEQALTPGTDLCEGPRIELGVYALRGKLAPVGLARREILEF